MPKVDDSSEKKVKKRYVQKVSDFFQKRRDSFDQTFLNDKDDQPIETRRTYNVSTKGGNGGTLLGLRNPSGAKQVVIKPFDFTIRSQTLI